MRRSALALLAILFCHVAVAQPSAIPADLKPWESWVMYGEEFRRCPLRNGANAGDASAFVCAWPGRMHVAVSSGAGEFRQSWRIYAESWVVLPGDGEHWPEDVRVSGNPAPAVEREGVPQVRLTPGDHIISGSFTWARRPESLQLAPTTALVDLSIDGKSIAPVELRAGRLWLGAVRTVTVPRALQVQVYRLLQDDIPLRLVTRLQLKVSGDAREEMLARVLPDGFAPMATSGNLPVRFEPDGRLRVQVRSGEHELTITARGASPGDGITVPQGEGAWADEEVWTYRSNDRLRITALEGAPPIDPIQAGVPDNWRDMSAFRLQRGATVTIAERSRGLSSADAHQLSLRRELWLTFDHDDFIAADRISGTMQQGWRLDMRPPYRLLNARRHDEMLLITDGADGRTGVEVRNADVDLTTLARVPRDQARAATGWDARFDNVWTTLNLPPGHRLLAAWGADDAPGAWVNQWRLLDLFLLMLAAVAAFRLLGWGGALLAAAVILLTHHETGAPGWLWVNLFLAVALWRLVPAGRLRVWVGRYQFISLVTLAFVLISFAVQQYRFALHPQLMPAVDTYGLLSSGSALRRNAPAEAAQDAAAAIEETVVTAVPVAPEPPPVQMEVPRMRSSEPQRLQRYAPDAMLQTGPGIPNWSYLTYQLRWSGPVDEQQTVRLTIVPPLLLSVWRILGVLAAAALLLALVKLAYGVPTSWRLPPWRSTAAAGLFLALLAASFAPRVQAQAPDSPLLGELKKRLSEPAKCVPDCVEAVLATVTVSGDRLDVQMQVHAQASVVLGIPQAGQHWIIERVAIDDRAVDSVARVGEHLSSTGCARRASREHRRTHRAGLRARARISNGAASGRRSRRGLGCVRDQRRPPAQQLAATDATGERRSYRAHGSVAALRAVRAHPSSCVHGPGLDGHDDCRTSRAGRRRVHVASAVVAGGIRAHAGPAGRRRGRARVDALGREQRRLGFGARARRPAAMGRSGQRQAVGGAVGSRCQSDVARRILRHTGDSAERGVGRGCGSTNSCRGPARRSTCRSYAPLRARGIPWLSIASTSRRASVSGSRIRRCISPIAAAEAAATTCVWPRMLKSSV